MRRRSFDEEALREWPRVDRASLWGAFTAPLSQSPTFDFIGNVGSDCQGSGRLASEGGHPSESSCASSVRSTKPLMRDIRAGDEVGVGKVTAFVLGLSDRLERSADRLVQWFLKPVRNGNVEQALLLQIREAERDWSWDNGLETV